MKTLFTPVLILFLISSIILNAQTDDNLLRVVKIRYNVFDMELGSNKEIDAVDGYELLTNNHKLDIIRPFVFYQNVSSNTITDFRANLKIINVAQNKTIYDKRVCVDSVALASAVFTGVFLVDSNGKELVFPGTKNLSGIPPGGYVKVRFFGFEPYEFANGQLGLLNVMAIAEPLTCDSTNLNEKYLEDNKKEITLFSMPLDMDYYNLTNYNSYYIDSSGNYLLNPKFWKTKGVDVVAGDDYVYEPLQPENSTSINDTTIHLKHPTIRMNRVDIDGKDLAKGKRDGDWMMSNIIDMRERYGSTLSFSYHRTGKIKNNEYSRGFSDSLLIGPEHRVIQDGDPTKEIRKPDELIVEFAYSDNDNIHKLVNPDESIWSCHPRKDTTGFITNNPALTIFGGGGYRRGFVLPNWHNNLNDSALTYEQGLNSDIYDTGKDFAFKQAFIPIPDTMVKTGGFLRIRFRVDAEDNSSGNMNDDADDFFLIIF